MGAKLSVNVNKVATLRNSRGGTIPSVLEAVRTCVRAGAPGITVHPRADQRHITPADVTSIAAELKSIPKNVEFNIEGDPRPDLIHLVSEVRPTQCTLVPVRPGEVTSQAGWQPDTPRAEIAAAITSLRQSGVRVSLFIEADPAAVKWASTTGADRVELYTEPYARAYERSPAEGASHFERYVEAAELAHSLGLGVNAGHDLDLNNLLLFRRLPHFDEASIGHALISHALFVGLEASVRDYIKALST